MRKWVLIICLSVILFSLVGSLEVILDSPQNSTYSNSLTQTLICNASDINSVNNITLYVWNSTNDVINQTLFVNNYTSGLEQSTANVTPFSLRDDMDAALDSYYRGIWIYARENFDSLNFTKGSLSTNVNFHLLDSSHNMLIDNGVFLGDFGVINYSFIKNTKYYLVCGNENSQWYFDFGASKSYENSTYVDIGGGGSGGAYVDGEPICIGSITAIIWSLPSLNTSNISLSITPPKEGNYKWNCLAANSTDLLFATNNNTLTIDTTKPIVSFVSPTDANNSYITTRKDILVNISVSDTNFANGTIYFYEVYNSSGSGGGGGGKGPPMYILADAPGANFTLNKTINFNITPYFYNFTNLSDGSYAFNVSVYDLANNFNNSQTNILTINTFLPTINIISPVSLYVYDYNTSLNLNYSVSDVSGIDSCWFKVANLTGIIIGNTTISNCTNTTFNLTIDGSYTLTLYANNTANNIQSSSVSFYVSTLFPAVNLIPLTFYTNNLTHNFLNFTVLGGTINNCSLYTNQTGSWLLNQTLTSITNGVMINFSSKMLNEGSYLWNVVCKDNFNKEGYSPNNGTHFVDVTKPNIIFNTLSTSDLSFTLNHSETDSIALDYCQWRLYNNLNVPVNNLTTISCNSLLSSSTSTAGVWTVYVYVNDKAGNQNVTSAVFVTQSPILIGGSGGNIILSGATANWTMTTDSGTKSYQIKMTKGSIRDKYLVFKNFENNAKTIKLSCVDINSSGLCGKMFIENEVKLPIIKDSSFSSKFTITTSEDIKDGGYQANIIATDEVGNIDFITISVDIGAFGVITNTFIKMGETKDFIGISIPYFLIFGLSVVIFGFGGYFIFNNVPYTKKYSAGISLACGLLVSFVIIGLL